ncbi:MAG: phage tail tape measure protein, partial [Ruminococcus sp.]|nr:phage tail tape measure protein [Ruminococcus sp.]
TAMNIMRAKDLEIGSATKFSASESGQAFEYMAMAGWKNNDMLNGVEGIMNLAAASGEELGTTSDIVTDALTALGYQAQDAGHFADVLAATSSNANTNVSMLGESFQYVAPVAGSMGANAEDLAIALGLMANSGIKASQAGNSLKNGLVNLVKPTEAQVAAMSALGLAYTETIQVFDDDAIAKAQEKVDKKTREYENAAIRQKDAVEQYGESSSKAQIATNNLEGKLEELHKAQEELTVAQQGTTKEVLTGADAFTDEYGNMKSLGEIMDVLRSSLSAVNVELTDSDGNLREYDDIIAELSQTEEGLVQSEQLKNAAILFGKQNLSGMLAIVNASEEDYEKLTNAIYNCDGTAQGMAETMQDNLQGQLTILMSQLQELAISFAEILMPAIRSIVTKIQELADKFNALSPHAKETITKVALITAALAPVLIVIGKVISTIGTILTIIP